MKSKSKLNNFGNGKVYISHDPTRTELEIQSQLRRIAIEEINKGGVVKITIDGKCGSGIGKNLLIKE